MSLPRFLRRIFRDRSPLTDLRQRTRPGFRPALEQLEDWSLPNLLLPLPFDLNLGLVPEPAGHKPAPAAAVPHPVTLSLLEGTVSAAGRGQVVTPGSGGPREFNGGPPATGPGTHGGGQLDDLGGLPNLFPGPNAPHGASPAGGPAAPGGGGGGDQLPPPGGGGLAGGAGGGSAADGSPGSRGSTGLPPGVDPTPPGGGSGGVTGHGGGTTSAQVQPAAVSQGLLGLAQACDPPDITSGALTHISYNQPSAPNVFHYDAIPLAITLGDGRRFGLGNPTGGARKTTLDVQLDNTTGAFAGGASNFTITGKVTIDGTTFDGTLVNGVVREFGSRINPPDSEFEVEIEIKGGSLTDPAKGYLKETGELDLLIHQPGLKITSFPQTFASTNTQGSSDACKYAEIKTNSNPVAPACGCNTTDIPLGGGGSPQNNASNTVYMNDGESHQQIPLMNIPGRGGMDFNFTLAYRSGIQEVGPLGHNWDSTYDLRLIQVNPENQKEIERAFPMAMLNDVVRIDGATNRADIYVYTPGNNVYPNFSNYTDPNGFFTRLVQNGDGSFTERDQSGTVINFTAPDTTGRASLSSEADRNGNTLSFSYNANGELSTVTDPLGRPITYTYDPNGLLSQVTDFNNRSLRFTYDFRGELVGVTTPAVTGTPNGNDFPNGKTTQFTYSHGLPDQRINHEMQTVTAPNEVATGGPARMTYTYDTDPNTPDVARVQSVTEGGTDYTNVPSGGTLQYSYQSLVSTPPNDTTTPVFQNTVTNRNGDVTQYQFNQLGNILQTQQSTNRHVNPGNAPTYTTQYQYSMDYLLLKETKPQGNTVTYTYDNSNPHRIEQGNLLSVTQTPDARGGDQSAAHPITTTYTYEPIYNQVHTMTEPRGNDPTYVPQNGGVQSAARYTTTYTYDYQEDSNFGSLGAPLGLSPAQTATLLATAAGGAGIAMSLGDVNMDGTVNQIRGNLIRTQQPTVTLLAGSNQAIAEGTTQQPIVTLYAYNNFGLMTYTIDPELNKTNYDYYTVANPSSGTFGPTNGGYLAHTYQDAIPPIPGRDTNTNPPPANIVHQYIYDAVGNVTRDIDGRGIETDYTVNQLNQVVQTTRAAVVPGTSPSEPMPLTAFQYLSRTFYDFNDNVVISQVEDRGNTSNVDGNPPAADLPTFVPGAANPDPVGGPAFQDTVYKYDILDQRVEKVDEVSNGANPEFLHTRMRYDPNGNTVLTIEPEGNATATYYDERDLAYQSTRGATGAAPLTLLAPGDPTSYDTRGGLPATMSYHYDLNGNLIESVAADDNDLSAANNSKVPTGTSTDVNTSTTLNDTTQQWMPNQWKGRDVLILSGTGAGQRRTVASNTATQLTLSTPWAVTPDATSVYAIQGDRTRYIYDGFDRRTSTVDSVGNQTVMQYDPAGNIIRTSTFGPVGGISPTMPSPTDDGPDTLLAPVSSLGVIQSGNLVHSADRNVLLSSTEMTYDELSRATQTNRVLFVNTIPTVRPADVAEGGSDVGLGNLNPGQNQPIPGVSGVTILGRVATRTEYDRDSRVTFTVNDDTTTTRNFYDGVSRTIKVVDPVGNTTEMAYDADSNVIETRETDVSQVSGVANEIFLTTNFYDSLNRLQESVDNLGQTMQYRYDSRGNLVAMADASGSLDGTITRRAFPDGPRTVDTTNSPGNVTRYYYDGLSRKVRDEQILTASGQGDGVHIGASIFGVKDDPTVPSSFTPTPDPNQGGGDGIIRTGYTYDMNSLQSALIDDQGNVTVYLYDNLDRRVSQTGGLTVNSTYTAANFLGPRTFFTPTAETINNPATIPSPLINTQLTEAKNRLNLIAPLFPSLANRVDDHPPTTTITGYDPNNNVLIRSDENNSYVYTKYDGIDRPIAVRIFRAGQTDSFAGDPLFAPNPASLPTNHSMDDEPAFQPVVGTTIQNFQYDGISRMTQAFDNNDPTTGTDDSTVTDAYDSLNRVIEETQKLDGVSTKAIDSAWRAEALRKSLTYPNGRVEVYTYDGLDRMASVADQGAAQAIATYQYIGVSRVLVRAYPINGTRETYLDNTGTSDIGYDGLRRPVVMRSLRSDNSLIVGFTYTYDRMNNKLTEGKLHDPNNSETYTYDSAYRLLSFHRTPLGIAPIQSTWKLDGVGNWDQVDAETRTYSSFNEITSRGATSIVSDDNGNETDDGTFVYTYDAMNRMRTVTRKSDSMLVATYSYDALGRRIEKVVTNSPGLNGTTVFYLDGNQEIEEHNGADALTQQYVYGVYIDEPLVLDRTAAPRLFYYQNTLYSVYALTDTSANIVEGYQYDAYGKQTVFTAPGLVGVMSFSGLTTVAQGGNSQFANPYLFTGRRLDPETGLYYYRARLFDPTEGRFLSRDPIGVMADLDLYEYAFDRPTAFADSLGLGHSSRKLPPAPNAGPWGKPADWCSGSCGPDITYQLLAVRAQVISEFSTWTWDEMLWGCSLGQFVFEIEELSPSSKGVRQGSCPAKTCANSVWMFGSCVYYHEANYYLYGVIKRLCQGVEQGFPAKSATFAWKLFWGMLNKNYPSPRSRFFGESLGRAYWAIDLGMSGATKASAPPKPLKCTYCEQYAGSLTWYWGNPLDERRFERAKGTKPLPPSPTPRNRMFRYYWGEGLTLT
jgi:RHS repeat-associated protein